MNALLALLARVDHRGFWRLVHRFGIHEWIGMLDADMPIVHELCPHCGAENMRVLP